QGRIVPEALRSALEQTDGPTIVCVQAGEVNTGAFDALDEAADAAAQHGAWLHVDAAFGIWAAAEPSLRHLLTGVERADSWAADARAQRRGEARRARVRPRSQVRGGTGASPRVRGAERRGAEPGALPLRERRGDGSRARSGPGVGRGVDERDDLAGTACDPYL